MWTNKQHIMSRLAAYHDVIYVCFGPCSTSLRYRSRERTGGPSWVRSPFQLWTEPSESVDRGVRVLRFYAPRRTESFAHGHPLRVAAEFELRLRLLKRYLAKHGVRDPIVWVYHPGYGASVKQLPHELIVYDCVDEYSAFPEFRGSEAWIERRERELCQVADVVFCTSAPLFEKKRELRPGRVHLVHNVGDAEHFVEASKSGDIPDEMNRLKRPIVAFVGAVSDYKLDLDWVRALAVARPALSIVLIGPKGMSDPTTDTTRLESLPNVHFLGQKAYADLPAYLRGSDICVIPYRINTYTEGVFPIKFFELLATGKPVVISALPSLREFFPSVLVAHSADEFIQAVDRGIASPTEGRDTRMALAFENSWPSRIRAMLEKIEQARVSACSSKTP